jgi:hypothetical protein
MVNRLGSMLFRSVSDSGINHFAWESYIVRLDEWEKDPHR